MILIISTKIITINISRVIINKMMNINKYISKKKKI